MEKTTITEDQKRAWLAEYEHEIRRRIPAGSRRPTWEHLPAGHLYVERAARLGPRAAARRYLRQTIFGKGAQLGPSVHYGAPVDSWCCAETSFSPDSEAAS